MESFPMAFWRGWSFNLLEHVGITNLHQDNNTDKQEQDNTDGGRQAVVGHIGGYKCQTIYERDQNISLSHWNGSACHGRQAEVENEDHIEVVEIEGKRGDQQRSKDGAEKQKGGGGEIFLLG